jgi:predicted permease
MEPTLHDLRYALRTLARSPGFALTAILTLALGIGATTAIYTVVAGVLLRPLPYPEPGRIMKLTEVNADGGHPNFTDPNFYDLREQNRSFAALAELSGQLPVSVAGGKEAVRSAAAAVSSDFFRVMGVGPAVGRAFLPEEQREGAAPTVVVGHAFWRQALGGEPIVGKTLRIDGRPYSVIGVMPEGFEYPQGVQLWIPRELEPRGTSRTAHNWRVVGRLATGVSVQQARADLGTIARRLKAQYGDDTDMVDASVVPLRESMVGSVRTPLLVLLGAAAFLLLIAVANVSNLLFARLAGRRRELAVRSALGAGRGRLTQQLVSESLVLGLAGGALGVLLAYWGTAALLALGPASLPRLGEVSVDAPVLLFALAVSVGAAVGLGLAGAASAAPTDLRGALAEGGRTAAGSGPARRVRDALVVAQVGLTLVLLAGAALMGRSLLRLLAVDTGFVTEGVLVADVAIPMPDGPSGAASVASFNERLLSRLRTLPGVTTVGGISDFPLRAGIGGDGTFLVLSRPDEVKSFEDWQALGKIPGRTGYADYRIASGDYFGAMGIPVLRGRTFSERDAPDAPITVAVVSESLAKKQWPGESPIGKLIQFGNMDGDMRALRVVGVVGDVREAGVDAEPQPTLYAYYRQRPVRASEFSFAIRTRGEPRSLIPAVRRAVREVDPEVPPRFSTIGEIVAGSTADRRFTLVLLGVFGAAALLLALAGIYGVVSYLVAQRTREFGVRMAFGAREADVRRMVLRQGAKLAGAGLALGLVVALGLTRVLRSQLYGVTSTDPAAYAAGILLLAAIALLASYVPARRATRVDPVNALRAE